MQERLLQFIKEIQTDDRYDSFAEPEIKQGIVMKILSFLEWDPFDVDEIQPEYKVDGGKIDFSLRHKDSSKAFIGIKRGVKALKEYQAELLDYAVQDGVNMAILTNGITWWFTLPLVEGSLEEKRFHTIDMNERKAEEVTQNFEDFLSKKNIVSGKSLKVAEHIYRTRLKSFLVKENLPKAWKEILSEPEKWLYDILAEVTEELCGHKPERAIVENFLALEIDANAEIPSTLKPKPATPPKEIKAAVKKEDFIGKSIVSFRLGETKYDVKSWKEMLLKICEVVAAKHREDFEIVLTLSGPNGEYFSVNPYKLLTCEKIPGTEMYVDVNLSDLGVVALSHRVLSLFGYKEKDLSIETK
jgi:hypothetical protein